MIKINLAPDAAHARASRRARLKVPVPAIPSLGADPRVLGLAAGGVLVLLLLGYAVWRQSARLETLRATVEQEVTDSTRFASTIELVRNLQARQDTIRQKIDVIRSVDQRRYVWAHLLDEISRAVPAYTWLTELSSVEAAAEAPPVPGDTSSAGPVAPVGPTFTLQGNAGSTQALTRFMKNLEASAFIRGVTLVTSEKVDIEGRTLHRFTLEARYEQPDPSVIKTVPIITVQ